MTKLKPDIKTIKAFKNLPVHDFQLDEGIKIFGFYNGDVKAVKIDFIFEAGQAVQRKTFLAAFVNAMMREGNSQNNSKTSEEILDYYGIFLNQKVTHAWSVFSFYLPIMHLDKALPVAYKMLFEPVFTEEALRFLKEKTRQRLRQNLQRTDYRAAAYLKNLMWGNNNPLGFYPHESGLDELNIDDIKDFYKTYYPNTCHIGVSGYFPKDIKQQFNRYFGEIPVSYSAPKTSSGPESTKPVAHHIKMPNKNQVSLKWGKHIPGPGHPDYFTLKVADTIFGGFFGSRLMRNIREEKAYTYGIYSTIRPTQYGCTHTITTDVGHDYLEDTIRQIDMEADKLKTTLVGTEELRLVQNYMAGELLSVFDGAFKHASIYRYLIEMDMDFSYYSDFLNTIYKLTPDDIRNVSNRHLDVKNMHKVTAG
ncbi:MAG TPA: pitrilysin family protein [Prolixibacteraceae bacterium]|nr:pitrilysin family protein [Prolixibacteraceae bacterium]